MGALHEDIFTFIIVSQGIPLRMGNVSDKTCRENQNTQFQFNNFVEKYGTARHATGDNIIWRMHNSCWKTKATDIPSEYAIIIACPCHQWLCECTPLYLYVHCLPC